MTYHHLPSGEYADINADDYRKMGISGFIGGASWLFIHGDYQTSYVVPVLTPIEIRRKVEAGEIVRAIVRRVNHSENYQM